MPKQISKDAYKPQQGEDSTYGSNAVLIADEDFDDIQVGYIGESIPDRGFSGMKFIPGTGKNQNMLLHFGVPTLSIITRAHLILKL